MICEPSASRQISAVVLERSEGRSTHWRALHDRLALCDNATSEQQADWLQRCDAYACNQSALETRALRDSVQKRIYGTMINDARKIQADLDALDVRVCACHIHHHGKASALWRRLMPQVICEAMPKRPSEHRQTCC